VRVLLGLGVVTSDVQIVKVSGEGVVTHEYFIHIESHRAHVAMDLFDMVPDQWRRMVKVSKLYLLILLANVSQCECMVCDITMVIQISSEALSLLDLVLGVTQSEETIIGHLVKE